MEWIKKEDKLPNSDQFVIFISELGAKFIGVYKNDKWFSNTDFDNPIDKHFNIKIWTLFPDYPDTK